MRHPAVQDCAVIGLPDDKWGERVTAILQLRAGATVDKAEVAAFVKARIGSVKTPKQIEMGRPADVEGGKVLKSGLRARLSASTETA